MIGEDRAKWFPQGKWVKGAVDEEDEDEEERQRGVLNKGMMLKERKLQQECCNDNEPANPYASLISVEDNEPCGFFIAIWKRCRGDRRGQTFYCNCRKASVGPLISCYLLLEV